MKRNGDDWNIKQKQEQCCVLHASEGSSHRIDGSTVGTERRIDCIASDETMRFERSSSEDCIRDGASCLSEAHTCTPMQTVAILFVWQTQRGASSELPETRGSQA